MADERRYVSGLEQDQISRVLLMWLNQYPNKPVGRMEFEYLPADKAGMSLSTVTAAYKTGEYVDGSYDAQYQFAILYRSQPETSGDRLNMDEILNGLGVWAETREDKPTLGHGKTVVSIERNSTASLIARYPDNAEDYQILMTMNYEVNNHG